MKYRVWRNRLIAEYKDIEVENEQEALCHYIDSQEGYTIENSGAIKDWWVQPLDNKMSVEEQLSALMEKYTELQAELDKHRWIPVSERLPEDGGLYLLTKDEGENLWLDIFGPAPNGFKCIKDYIKLHKITHWRPIILPEQALQGKEGSEK